MAMPAARNLEFSGAEFFFVDLAAAAANMPALILHLI
jgi:hypothetical protein